MKTGGVSSDLIIKSARSKNTIIAGYASVFDLVDSQNDVIRQGAFASASVRKVKLLWQHDPNKPIGSIKSLSEDAYGLKFEAEINNEIETGREASALIKQGAICGLSIGFSVNSFVYDKNGIRVINGGDLSEISVVTFPANEKAEITSVKSKSGNEAKKEISPIDELSNLTKQLNQY
jgi:uncharacterized protein